MKTNLAAWRLLIFLIIHSFLLYSCCHNNNNVVKIGANLPLTGELSLFGQNDKKGIDLALETSDIDLNVEIIFEDNKGSIKDAVNVANKLMNENLIAVIDDAISGISLATIPIYEKNKLPLISTGSTNPSLSGISPYFFRIWNSDTEEGDFAAKSAFNVLNKKIAVVLYLNSDYGLGLKNVFEKQYIALGGIVQASIAFDENTRDYRATITQFINLNYDLIYVIGYAPQTGPLVKNIREQRINKTILSTVATEDEKFIDLAGDASEGVAYVFNNTPNGANYEQFVNLYRKKYNEEPQLLTDVGYDATKLLLMAIKDGARTGEDVKNFLKNMDSYEGASGMIKFDENGDIHKPMKLKIIKNNKFEDYII